MLDIQFDPQAFVTSSVKVEPQPQLPKIIAVKVMKIKKNIIFNFVMGGGEFS